MTPLGKPIAALAAASLTLAAASCAANPGPPPLVEDEPAEATTHTTTAGEQAQRTQGQRTQVQVGVDPLRNGLNPHLAADESEVVRSVAELVLPSAFNDGVRNADILDAATLLPTTPSPDVAMTVRYIIADEAQWSDGTPLTGADFAYLWRGMADTPGALDPAGYRAISKVRVSGELGKVVDVDFTQPVAGWESLFNYLLPSHLFAPDASDFAGALRETIPASAGRYSVSNVDRGRATITLNRNDRFWGAEPARIDVLTLVGVRDTTQAADQLRSGQLAFADLTPGETTSTVLPIVRGVQTRTVDAPRTLGVTLSTTSPLLASLEAREELRSLIDVPLIARIAAGRSTDLAVAEHRPVTAAAPSVLPAAIGADRPLRIGADPADTQAAAAARSLVDILAQRGVRALVVSTDMRRMTSAGLPHGDVDAVVSWLSDTGSAAELAGRVFCQPADSRAGNLAGLCTPETEALAYDVLTGRTPLPRARQEVRQALDAEAVWVPVLHERRIRALTGSIVGPSPDLAGWPDGVATAAAWRLAGAEPGSTPTTTSASEQEKQQ